MQEQLHRTFKEYQPLKGMEYLIAKKSENKIIYIASTDKLPTSIKLSDKTKAVPMRRACK